ncbi:hypothetical protein KCU65_g9324, partial [Aureobasidium melanogenum]
MSGYQEQDPLKLAQQAERDLNSHGAKHGQSNSDSALESGVDESVTNKFPGAEVNVGSTGASSNQRLPLSEGNDIDPSTGKPYKAAAFDGPGGPEKKAEIALDQRGGDDEIRSNVRN